MAKSPITTCVVLAAALALAGIPGCSKKAVQSGGDQSSAQGKAQDGSGTVGGSGGFGSLDGGDKSGIGSFPDTTMQSGSSSGALKGLDKNPSEERIGGGSGGGQLMAKADPGSSARQMEDIRGEQAAAAAGLRDVFFAFDSWMISEEGRQALSRDAEWMKSNPSARLRVEGHCDERGTSAYNLVLGEKRAKAVRNYLVELGVGANRLAVVSYGKERPFCNEHQESCYQQNRRGHLVLRTGK